MTTAQTNAPINMATAVDLHDWSQHALGPREHWPEVLSAFVRFVLNAKTAQFVAWGPELRIIYNDAYVSILDDRHPKALGARLWDVWPELENEMGALVEQALAGTAVYFDEVPFLLRTRDAVSLRWFDFALTPITLADGTAEGIHVQLRDITQARDTQEARLSALAKLETLFRQSPGFMAVTQGPDHRYVLVNEADRRLLGNRPLIGLTVRNAVPEFVEQGFVALLDKVWSTGEAATGTATPVDVVIDGQRQTRYLDYVLQPIKDGMGTVTGVLIQGSDVTAHVEALRRLEASEARARKLAQQSERERAGLDRLLSAAAVGLFYVDTAGRLVFANAASRALGGELPATESTRDYGKWKAWWADGSARHGEPVAQDEWPLVRSLNGEEVRNALISIEPFNAPGTRRIVLLQSAPTYDAQGAIDGAVVAQVDVTGQFEAERRLRESEARFRTITDAMPQMVWSTLPDGYHDFYNRRWYEFTGVPEGSTDGEGWNGMFHPDDQEEAWARWRHSLATGETYEIEYRLRHRSGEYRWVLGRALPVRDEDGAIIRWMGTCTDIHDQKAAHEALEISEASLRHANARKDEFLATLAHELRNPLAPIGTAAQVLAMTAGSDPRLRSTADVIQRQVRHMSELVDDLLDVSRITRGLIPLRLHSIDLNAAVREAVEQARPLIDRKRHALSVVLSPDPVWVLADSVRLTQVVANLLNNAAKYTDEGGVIELTVRSQNGQGLVTVRDSGHGIAADLLPHIFDLFTQADITPDRAGGGLGIGLAIVRNLVELHGGRVKAESAGPGHGSTFTVALSLAAPEQGTPSSP